MNEKNTLKRILTCGDEILGNLPQSAEEKQLKFIFIYFYTSFSTNSVNNFFIEEYIHFCLDFS